MLGAQRRPAEQGQECFGDAGDPSSAGAGGAFFPLSIAARYLLVGLPADTNEEEIMDYFSAFGDLEEAQIKPSHGGVGGSVKFLNPTAELREMMLFGEHAIKGVPIKVTTWKGQKLQRPGMRAAMMGGGCAAGGCGNMGGGSMGGGCGNMGGGFAAGNIGCNMRGSMGCGNMGGMRNTMGACMGGGSCFQQRQAGTAGGGPLGAAGMGSWTPSDASLAKQLLSRPGSGCGGCGKGQGNVGQVVSPVRSLGCQGQMGGCMMQQQQPKLFHPVAPFRPVQQMRQPQQVQVHQPMRPVPRVQPMRQQGLAQRPPFSQQQAVHTGQMASDGGIAARYLLTDMDASVTEGDLLEYFQQFGEILEVTLKHVGHDQRPTGSVKFADPSMELRQVMLGESHEINGAPVTVQTWKMQKIQKSAGAGMSYGMSAMAGGQVAPCQAVVPQVQAQAHTQQRMQAYASAGVEDKSQAARFLLSNLPPGTEEQDIVNFFSWVGNITETTLKNLPNGMVTGSVKFTEPTPDMRNVMLGQQHILGGQQVVIETWKMQKLHAQANKAKKYHAQQQPGQQQLMGMAGVGGKGVRMGMAGGFNTGFGAARGGCKGGCVRSSPY